MRTIIRSFLTVTALMAVLAWSVMGAEQGDKADKGKRQTMSLYKAAGEPIFAILNINNFTAWVRYDGPGNLSPAGDNLAVFPRGTGNVIYTDGVYWGAKCYTDAGKTISAPHSQLVRVGGKGYGFGLRPGWVDGTGAAAVRHDPNDPNVRIYRIRRDYASMSSDELKRDAAETNEVPIAEVTDAQMAGVKAQYEKDWTEWPVAHGAPYVDRNNNGTFDAPPPFSDTFTVDSLIAQNRDEPGVAGSDPNSPADQVIYTVANDLDAAQAISFQYSEPLGLEAQFTIWGYKRTDALGNLYFKRFRLINKGGVDVDAAGTKGSFYLDSVFVCNWSDIDMGSFSDDLAGCDSTLSVGFVYNGNAIDDTFRRYGLPPPCPGYDFLAGPFVPAPGDSAVFDLKRKYDYKNLGMSSFAYFSAGSPYSDPCNRETGGYACNTGQWWKMLRGYAPIGTIVTPDIAYASGPFPASKFPLSGDPVTHTGFLDGLGTDYSFAPGDRRILLSTGPFEMAPGDTQDVVVGVVAGLGADRLSSVAVMKFNDRFVQNTFDALFQVPRPPKSPNVTVAELDGEVVLDWGSDLTRLKDIEQIVSNPGAYKFEGYNVYQLPSRSSQLKDSKRVVTYDLPTDPTVVLDQQFDQTSGQILSIPVEFGTNSGITRYFDFKKDYIRDIDKIYNGQEYYLAVTAYSVASVPGYLPAALESAPVVLTVRPKVPFGKVLGSSFGDTLKFTHAGVSDGVVRPIVIDPTASTGDTYEVRFDTTGGTTTWKLLNKTKGTTLLSNQTNQSGDDNYKMMEGGVYLKVEGPPPGVKDWEIPSGSRRWTWADADGNGFEGFSGAIGWESPAHYFNGVPNAVTAAMLKNTLIKLAQVSSGTATNSATGIAYAGWDRDATTDPNISYAYRYLRGATGTPAQPEFAPFFINTSASYGYQDYKKSVPFSAWDVEANPPVRLAVGFLENNTAKGLVDGCWWPPPNGAGVTNTESGGPREWFFIFNTPYTDVTPDPALQKTILSEPLPVMWWGTVNRRGGANFCQGAGQVSGDDQFLILANHVNLVTDVFTFTEPAAQTGLDVAKQSAKTVGVYPNPYYAFNPAETNRFSRFVTFNNLPPKATFRIFNLAGQLVRRIDKDDPTQFASWDLLNEAGYPVASGMYIVHVDMPDIGVTKILKVAIIQEQEILDSY